jgi:hypothetical protein
MRIFLEEKSTQQFAASVYSISENAMVQLRQPIFEKCLVKAAEACEIIVASRTS